MTFNSLATALRASDLSPDRAKAVYLALRLAAQTRDAQRRYFRTRDPQALRESKAIEADLDAALAAVADLAIEPDQFTF